MSPPFNPCSDLADRCASAMLDRLLGRLHTETPADIAYADLASGQAVAVRLPAPSLADNQEHYRLQGQARDHRGGDDVLDDAIRCWTATNLTLSSDGQASVLAAQSWTQIYSAMFSDPCFGERMTHILEVRPPSGGYKADRADVDAIYRLFLGRPPEFDPNLSGLVGRDLYEVLIEVLSSSEFYDHTQQRVFSGGSHVSSWDRDTLDELGQWARHRLRLSPRSQETAICAQSRHILLLAILSDRHLWAALGREFLAADTHFGRKMPVSIQAMIIEATMLFEHDRYLHDYINVAASGGHPLYHYLNHGVEEATNPNRMFDTRWYLSAHPEVRLEPVSPLIHYIFVGARRGFKPHPFFPEPRIPSRGDPLSTPLGDYFDGLSGAQSMAAQPSLYNLRQATENLRIAAQRRALLTHIAIMVVRPIFFVYDPSSECARSNLLVDQIYPDFEIVDTISALRERFERETDARPIGIVWLESSDLLAENALYEFAARLNADPALDVVYGDEEIVAQDGSRRPFHKPDWSPDYLESCNYVGAGACVFGRRALEAIESAHSQYDWILRATEMFTVRVSHVRKILLSTQHDIESLSPERSAKGIEALQGRLARTGRTDTPVPIRPNALAYTIRPDLARMPLVSIVIPTAAKIVNYEEQRIDLLFNCISSIDSTTTYDNIEYIVIDNGDLDRARIERAVTRPLYFVTYSDADVNIARKINMGGEKASGDYILILNDDIVPLEPDWIAKMVAHFQKPHVGLVGARLLYPSGLVQHSGMVSCDGIPVHVDRFAIGDEPGYFFGRLVARNFLAVTGAVTMVSREIFDAIGGYDETFPIDFNDVDFAYRIGAQGYQIVYEPGAKLIHFESVSAVKPPRPWDRDHFEQRWAHISVDPFYNEYCLTKHSATSKVRYSERRH